MSAKTAGVTKSVELALQARRLLPTGPPPEPGPFRPKPLPLPQVAAQEGQLDIFGGERGR
jgi:hypothetical protein